MIKKLGKAFRARVQNMSEKEAGQFLVSLTCFVILIVSMPTLLTYL